MHEELKAQYAKDAAVHPRPWELWLARHCGIGSLWDTFKVPPQWKDDFLYRRHKHADLMIEAHQRPEYEWEFDALCDGNFVPCAPQWAENKVYRRKHPHQKFLDAVNAGMADEWEAAHRSWRPGYWETAALGLRPAAIADKPEEWKTRRKAVPEHDGVLPNGDIVECKYKIEGVASGRFTTTVPHPHAESMKLYAEDAAETNKPWERWEMRNPARTQEWATLDSDVYWVRTFEYRRKNKHQELLDAVAAGKADEWEVHYKRWATGDWGSGGNEAHVWEIERHQNDWETRRKPQTITVNGREVPVPYKGPLDTDKVYFVASPTAPEYVITASDCIRMCSEWASRCILHLTKEAAVAHAKAMLGVDE